MEQIGQIGIVPVIAINDVEKAVPLAKALLAGGIPCAEVTFRNKPRATPKLNYYYHCPLNTTCYAIVKERNVKYES